MRYVLPGIVLAVFTSLTSFYRLHAESTAPKAKTLQASQSAQTFIRYANALSAFQLRNPAFVGSVTGAQLTSMGSSFSNDFLSKAGNNIEAFGSVGRRLTAYSQLQPGGLGDVIELTEGDASYGTSNGSTWTSISAYATAQPLSANAPTGSTVYVIEIGR